MCGTTASRVAVVDEPMRVCVDLDGHCSRAAARPHTAHPQMTQRTSTVKLLLTISGGLESLAEQQTRSAFKEVLLDAHWHLRRPSGSQLHLTLHHPVNDDVVPVQIADALKQLDYVEYVFVRLGSFGVLGNSVNTDDSEGSSNCVLLQKLEEATSNISETSIHFCTSLCDAVDSNASNVIGQERLPGVLIPSLDVSPPSPTTDITTTTAPTRREFDDVNTIYTKQHVAQAVVQTVRGFIQQHGLENTNTLWVDAGSGNGALLDHLPQYSLGFDTHPASSRVHQMDFLTLTRRWLKQQVPRHESVCIISNPPFSSSSRGDYTPIVQFINHSVDSLGAAVVAVICPTKFARQRIWKSLGMTDRAQLMGRCLLPKDSFYNPSSGKSVHIHSTCLIFRNRNAVCNTETSETNAVPKTGVYVSSKRDKGCYPDLSTGTLTSIIVQGLSRTGMELVPERQAKYLLHAKLNSATLDLWWQINPNSPCSLSNCNSMKVENHSLGELSSSVKPQVALAMSSAVLADEGDGTKRSTVVVNLMSGEGTIELESSRATSYPFFLVSGDKCIESARKTAWRIEALKRNSKCNTLVDVVIWDAQHLPLREGIADGILADLPFQGGSTSKTHQQPSMRKIDDEASPPLSYSRVLSEASRILRPKGRAALLSPDFKALRFASNVFNWTLLGYAQDINVGGLTAKMFLMQRRDAWSKDISLYVPSTTSDLSPLILTMANEAVESANVELSWRRVNRIVRSVHLHNKFVYPENKIITHCYRITFDDQIKNFETKQYEQVIRQSIKGKLPSGVVLR